MNWCVDRLELHGKKVAMAPDAIDTVIVDGIKIEIGDMNMAQRKSPQVTPVLDNSAPVEPEKVEFALPKRDFDKLIRYVKRTNSDGVAAIRTLTHQALRRLGAKRDVTKTINGIPKGSDQVDVGSIKRWLSKIEASDPTAIKQLVALDATVCHRGC